MIESKLDLKSAGLLKKLDCGLQVFQSGSEGGRRSREASDCELRVQAEQGQGRLLVLTYRSL